jgi:type I restriction enzyme S subunit
LVRLITKHEGELSAKALWQQSGLEIDAFYQQLKTEMANGWIVEPEKTVMKEVRVFPRKKEQTKKGWCVYETGS